MNTTADNPTPPSESPDVRPSVSVVVATHNRPELLANALSSIMGQEYAGTIECIVVFDRCEPDATLERSDPSRIIRVTTNVRSPGLAGARNSGVALATGDWVAFCDDDDEWFPTKIQRQMDLLDQHPDVGLASCGLEIVYDDEIHTRLPTVPRLGFDDLLRDRVTEAHPSTIVVRRDLFEEQIGPVDEEIPGSYAEDYEWLLRATRVTDLVSVEAPLVRILWGGTSYFTGRFEMIADALTYLLERYPEFDRSPEGKARILGQIAFSQAGSGRRVDAVKTAASSVKLHWRELRNPLAVGVAVGALDANWVIRQLNSRGRGI